MKIKTATRLGMIGAIISIVLTFIYLLINLDVIKLVPEDMDYDKSEQIYKVFNVICNLCSIFSAFTLATFFYVLHKNQK